MITNFTSQITQVNSESVSEITLARFVFISWRGLPSTVSTLLFFQSNSNFAKQRIQIYFA